MGVRLRSKQGLFTGCSRSSALPLGFCSSRRSGTLCCIPLAMAFPVGGEGRGSGWRGTGQQRALSETAPRSTENPCWGQVGVQQAGSTAPGSVPSRLGAAGSCPLAASCFLCLCQQRDECQRLTGQLAPGLLRWLFVSNYPLALCSLAGQFPVCRVVI